MKNLRPWLVLGLVFIAGVAVGVGGTRIAVKKIIEQASAQPEWVAGRIERGLVRELRITPEQRPKLHEVVMRSHDEVQQLRREVRPRLGQILKRSEGEIRAMLNERQQQKFDEMLKKRPVLPQPARFEVAPQR